MEAPEALAADVTLNDGSLVRVAPATMGDRDALRKFLASLSEDNLRFRFNAPPGERDRLLPWLLPSSETFALVAWHEGEVVAHASFHRISPEAAEPGIIVADALAGKGLATILLGELSEAADAAGIRVLEHLITPENARMLEVIRNLGFPVHQEFEPGFVRIIQPTSISPEVLERFFERESAASAAAVRSVLRPHSIALIGASNERGGIGGELFHNLVTGGFPGPVYPVNPKSKVVQSVPAYASVTDCPGPVDLAIIAVPVQAVNTVAEECARKGVRSLVVISAGFGEAGPEGREIQRRLVEICRHHGMRIIGPNCMGLANTSPDVRMNGQFSPQTPARGSIGFLSQSGAVGLALINYANHMGLGMSSFISVGNKVDLSGNDFLNYWEGDADTKQILLYLESFGNPRKFARIAGRVARKKPIIAVKGGRSSAGFRATQSHTGALLAASDVTVDALFRECGVIRTDTLEEMFDVATFLDGQPVPRGRRVGIITNAGGAGILAADACENLGLVVPELSAESQKALRAILRPDASVRNPVDMVASANLQNYRNVMDIVSRDAAIDTLIVIFIPPLTLRPEDVGKEILAASERMGAKLPVLAVLMSPEMPSVLTNGTTRVPCYHFPESAAAATARVAEYGAWLAQPVEYPPEFADDDHARAAGLVSSALAEGGGWLPPEKVQEVLRCWGIPTVASRVVTTPEEAGRAADQIGGPVVLKGIAPGLLHKRDAGAVVLDLQGGATVERTARTMAEQVKAKGSTLTGYLVQAQVGPSLEMLVGVTYDIQFGPLVACGAGGTLVELLKDVSVRLAPLTARDVDEMLGALKTFPLLNGYRGGPKYDMPALRDLLLRVGRMADALHGILEMDLNPVMLQPEGHGFAIVDARIRVGEVAPGIPLSAKKR